MQILYALHEILDRYDVFILDQYGVLHDGSNAFPGAVDCFNSLVQTKIVIILSNTSRRAASIPQKLAHFGFDSHRILGSVTGGEEVYKYLQDNFYLRKCSAITHSLIDSNLIERRADSDNLLGAFSGYNPLQLVYIEQADFLLVEGSSSILYSDDEEQRIDLTFFETGIATEPLLHFLAQGKRRNLKMLCTNPDLVSFGKNRAVRHMGGKIARMYEDMGGDVIYFGKPMKTAFENCIALARNSSQSSENLRMVHVGDSLHHDIMGAQRAGIDSVFIAGGIHVKQLLSQRANDASECIQKSELEELCKAYSVEPTYVLRYFE